jgi:carbamoyltransferase
MHVLGVNFSNDAAAALVRDGEVLGAVQEERFSRQKHDRRFPQAAISWCLKSAGLTLADVDAVAFFWNPGRHAESPNWRQSGAFRHHLEYLYDVPNHLLPRLGGVVDRVEQTFHFTDRRRPLRVVYVTHHIAHAVAALVRSNFESAAILTVDGYGERTSTLIADGQGNRVTPLVDIEFPHSLGAVYAAVTQYLGFQANSGEGKVMGLASYGEPRFRDEFAAMLRCTADGFRVDLDWYAYFLERPLRVSDRFVARFGPPREPESELTQHHMDVAASLQVATEDALVHLARLARARTGRTRLCMAGGVTLNCVANQRILDEAGFDACYFMPAAGDAGSSLGAALALVHRYEDRPRREHPRTDYLGPAFSDEQVLAALRRAGVPFLGPAALNAPVEEAVVEVIENGFIAGWFQGAAEFGPRALGNRSILADPRRPEMKDVLNARVKFREWFRPFAPSVLEDRCGDFFACATPSPYMLRVYPTRPERVSVLPAVTHVDGGARVQTVAPEQNPRYHALISAFGRRTGVPVVLNTSFNIRGEPIVNSVEDALKCFFATDMDVLAVGPYLLEKRPGLLAEVRQGRHAAGFGPLPRFGQ